MPKSPVHFRHPLVRDLAWAIGSAPLLEDPQKKSGLNFIDPEWMNDRFDRHLPWLQQQDQHPTLLEKFLESEHIELVGKRFEALIKFWLTHHPDFELKAANIQFSNNEKTIGEIDFIVYDKWTEELFQMETACKYYYAHTSSADWNEWWGPNHQDRLGLKVQKFKSQTALLKTAQGRQICSSIGAEKIPSAVFLKGYLFYPFNQLGQYISPHLTNKKHNSGWFVKRDALLQFKGEIPQWVILPKSHWLAPYHSENNSLDIISGDTLFVQLHDKKNERATLIAQVKQDENGFWNELNRGLVLR